MIEQPEIEHRYGVILNGADRITLPLRLLQRWKEKYGQEVYEVVLSPSSRSSCIDIFPVVGRQERVDDYIGHLHGPQQKKLREAVISRAIEVDITSGYQITIPEKMRKHAGLTQGHCSLFQVDSKCVLAPPSFQFR